MEIEGAFWVHRNVFRKLTNKPPAYFKLWIWIISEAFFQDGVEVPKGTFHTTMADMIDQLSYYVGRTKKKAKRQSISNYLKDLVDNGRICVSKYHCNCEWRYHIKVLNYSKYQQVVTHEVAPEDAPEDALGPSIPLYDKEKEKKQSGPLAKFRLPKGGPIVNVKAIVEAYENGTIPREFFETFVDITMRDGNFPRPLAEKKAQEVFNDFFTYWSGEMKKKKDWYRTFQNGIGLYLKRKFGGVQDLNEYLANYNHAYEMSHGGNQYDASELPPEFRAPETNRLG